MHKQLVMYRQLVTYKTACLSFLLIQSFGFSSRAQQTSFVKPASDQPQQTATLLQTADQTLRTADCGLQLLTFKQQEVGQAQQAVYSEHYYKRLSEFKQELPIKKKEIIMIGNSLTENGGNWSLRLHKKHVRNRGIIGDDAQGIYDRLEEITAAKPKKIFIMVGINDISHDLSADSIMHQIIKVIDRIRKETPKTKLYVQSILPINESFGRYKKLVGKSDLIPVINVRLKMAANNRGAQFIDLFPLFTEQETIILRKEITNDGLHLNEKGYEIWSKELKKHL